MKIPVNGVTLQYTDTNARPAEGSDATNDITLVFLHHYGGSSQTWREIITLLRPFFRCVALDLRGFGASSPAPNGGGYTVGENADDVLALVAALGLQRYALVGHSMGGKIALAVAARPASSMPASALVALSLIAPSPPTPEPMSDKDRAATRVAFGDRAEASRTVEKIVAHPLPPAIHERTVADMMRVSEGAWQAWLDAGSKENIADQMGEIRVPVFIVAGERDSIVSEDLLRSEVAARVTDSRLIVLSDTGHLSPLEQPDAVAEQVRLACA